MDFTTLLIKWILNLEKVIDISKIFFKNYQTFNRIFY